MRPTRIFLDLDDVCNRFTMYALRMVGCPVDSWSYRDFNPEWGWDIVKAANTLHPTRRFTVADFWNSIGREVWANVHVSEEFIHLLADGIAYVGIENVCILSCPTLDPDCLAGKVEWIHSHVPKPMQRQYLIGPRKHFCARPDALLIDDSDANVQAFRQHGGQAILMPRPWNVLYEIKNPLTYVQHAMKQAFDGGSDATRN